MDTYTNWFCFKKIVFCWSNYWRMILLLRFVFNNRPYLSFENLWTLDGHIYDTFKETCLVIGLFESDNESIVCLQEAFIIWTRSQLHNLLVTLLIHCSPNEFNNLWE
jgi:hypothetical protein